MSEPDFIVVEGAREHNLKSVTLEIPKKKLVVFTGRLGLGQVARSPSTRSTPRASAATSSRSRPTRGSSSARWRSRSTTRIRGLSPTIAIEQKAASNNPRSTVGTITEIYDYLRVLYARVGRAALPPAAAGRSARRRRSRSSTRSCELPEGTRRSCCSRRSSRTARASSASCSPSAQKRGFVRVRVDGMVVRARRAARARQEEEARHRARRRPRSSLEGGHPRPAHRLGRDGAARGQGRAHRRRRRARRPTTEESDARCSRRAQRLPACGIGFPELAPQSFSFNSRSACARSATASGRAPEIDPDLVVPDPTARDPRRRGRAVGERDGARRGLDRPTSSSRSRKAFKIDLDKPWKKLAEEAARRAALRHRRQASHRRRGARAAAAGMGDAFEGVVDQLDAPLQGDRARRRCGATTSSSSATSPARPATASACGPRVARGDGRRARRIVELSRHDRPATRTTFIGALRAHRRARRRSPASCSRRSAAGSASCSTSASTT